LLLPVDAESRAHTIAANAAVDGGRPEHGRKYVIA
jgi:hypothetical protein